LCFERTVKTLWFCELWRILYFRSWASAEIFPGGGKVDILLIIFRLLTMQCTWTFTKRFTLSTPQRKCPVLRQQSKRWQQRFFITHASFHTVENYVA